jgi:hypothetical protein
MDIGSNLFQIKVWQDRNPETEKPGKSESFIKKTGKRPTSLRNKPTYDHPSLIRETQ